MTEIKIGDVVQINPEMKNCFFPGCYLYVTEVKTWGVQGFVCMPNDRVTPPGKAYFRCKFEDIEKIGSSPWQLIPEEEAT